VDHIIVSAVCAMLGAALPVLVKFALEIASARRKAQSDERADVWNEAAKLRQDLQAQILDLRSVVVKLQEDNLRYVVENTQLKGKVTALEGELADVRADLAARVNEVSELKATRAKADEVQAARQRELTRQIENLSEEVHQLRGRGPSAPAA
jgi:peptidoglycan hydrolase CwlO-like protein